MVGDTSLCSDVWLWRLPKKTLRFRPWAKETAISKTSIDVAQRRKNGKKPPLLALARSVVLGRGYDHS
jgi:hypothetical protein